MTTLLSVSGVEKSFIMHLRDGVVLPVVEGVAFEVAGGECIVLGGPSGAGKSSILKMVYGNYGVDGGAIRLRHGGDWVDLATASPRTVIELRRDSIGYVSQFLRTVPRVTTLDVVTRGTVRR
ncbi:MAG: ATP-binding cassette domain-containing protein, partial [Hyphomicrobiales bacterium]